MQRRDPSTVGGDAPEGASRQVHESEHQGGGPSDDRRQGEGVREERRPNRSTTTASLEPKVTK